MRTNRPIFLTTRKQHRVLLALSGVTAFCFFALNAAQASVMLSGNNVVVGESDIFTGLVATFTDTNSSDTPASFLATINWGDGTASTGTITEAQGTFSITGTHTYNDELSGVLGISLLASSSPSGPPIATANPNVTVKESDVLSGPLGATITGQPGRVLTDVFLASFDDANAMANVSDFTATINWGDGTPPDIGTITMDQVTGAFDVTGSHTYSVQDTFTITTTLADDSPGTSSDTATGTAVITVATTSVPEPSSIALFVSGIAGLFASWRRGRRMS